MTFPNVLRTLEDGALELHRHDVIHIGIPYFGIDGDYVISDVGLDGTLTVRPLEMESSVGD